MLEAKSVAVLGASDRAGSFGRSLVEATTSLNYPGKISFINPKRSRILGYPCYADLSALDHAPDVVVIGVGGPNVEASLVDAIDAGAGSAVIFDSCQGMASSGEALLARLRDVSREANFPVCGGNGMGFINVPDGCVASFYDASALEPGNISLIAHSGSVFSVIAMNDPRYRFDLIASSGQEIGSTIDEYIDFVVDRPTTKAIAVFMETARNPEGFRAALKRAQSKGVPTIVCKVGRHDESARMALSHTGAMTGSKDAYEAIIEDCGAISVSTIDELMNTAMLCSSGKVPRPGGAGLVTDSGGLRELMMDRAIELGAPLAELSDVTVQKLSSKMPVGILPSNPIDCATDIGDEYPGIFEQAIDVFDTADEVSMIGFEADLRDGFSFVPGMTEIAETLYTRTDKPCFLYSCFTQASNRRLGGELARLGVPCLNGSDEVLKAVRNYQYWADRQRVYKSESDANEIRCIPEPILEKWRERLCTNCIIDEASSLSLLRDFGVPSVHCRVCSNTAEIKRYVREIDGPVVMKTAADGIAHKSDDGGVLLNLNSAKELEEGYLHLKEKFGSNVIIEPFIASGIELAFGIHNDSDFGPIVMVSAGGIHLELFSDRQFSPAPVTPEKAVRMIERLSISKLLKGHRGLQGVNIESIVDALVNFSNLAVSLGDVIQEIDINPIIVTDQGVLAVDALIIPVAKV